LHDKKPAEKAAGNAALAAKDFDAAIEAYTKAIAVDSTDTNRNQSRSSDSVRCTPPR
jgi:hypothetical protein